MKWCLSASLCLGCSVESVQDAVGRQLKLSLRKKVQLEGKGDKQDIRILVSEICAGGAAMEDHATLFPGPDQCEII